VRIQQIIKEVADNLDLSYKDVNDIIRFAFGSAATSMRNKEPKITVRYIGTFTKKLSKRESYKKFKKLKDENNRDK